MQGLLTDTWDWPTNGIEQKLDRYEHLAKLAQEALVDAFTDHEVAMDRMYPHLRRAHLPLRVPSPNVSLHTATMEIALSVPRKSKKVQKTFERYKGDKSHPDHPEHVPLTDDQKDKHWSQGGYVEMPEWKRVDFRIDPDEIRAAGIRAKAKLVADLEAEDRRLTQRRADEWMRHQEGPRPWKEPR